MLGETASATDKEELRRQLGLDQPVLTRYSEFLADLSRGDLGDSLYENAEVAELIAARLPATIELTVFAMGFAVLVEMLNLKLRKAAAKPVDLRQRRDYEALVDER